MLKYWLYIVVDKMQIYVVLHVENIETPNAVLIPIDIKICMF